MGIETAIGLGVGALGLMGGGGGGDGVSVTDPALLAELEAKYNRGNVITPFGSLYRFGDKRENARIELTPEQQAVVNRALMNAQGVQAPASAEDATQAAYAGLMGRIQPDFDRRRRMLQSQLDASGNPSVGVDLAPGAVGELDVLERARNDAMIQAAAQATTLGQQSRLADLQVGSGYQQLLNNNATLFGGGSLFPIQQQPINIMGAYQMMQQAQAANAQANADSKAGKNSMFGQIAGAAIPLFV